MDNLLKQLLWSSKQSSSVSDNTQYFLSGKRYFFLPGSLGGYTDSSMTWDQINKPAKCQKIILMDILAFNIYQLIWQPVESANLLKWHILKNALSKRGDRTWEVSGEDDMEDQVEEWLPGLSCNAERKRQLNVRSWKESFSVSSRVVVGGQGTKWAAPDWQKAAFAEGAGAVGPVTTGDIAGEQHRWETEQIHGRENWVTRDFVVTWFLVWLDAGATIFLGSVYLCPFLMFSPMHLLLPAVEKQILSQITTGLMYYNYRYVCRGVSVRNFQFPQFALQSSIPKGLVQ